MKFFDIPMCDKHDTRTNNAVTCNHILVLHTSDSTSALMCAPDFATAEKIADAIVCTAMNLATSTRLASHVDYYRVWLLADGSYVRDHVMTYG